MNQEDRLLKLLSSPGYRPMKRHELARAMRLESKERRAELRRALHALEKKGKVVCLRKNRWALAKRGGRVVGTIRMMPKGGAIFVPDAEGADEMYVSDRDAGIALPDDRVEVEALSAAGRPARNASRHARGEGRVVRVLERANPETVGLLCRMPYYDYVVADAPGFRHEVRVANAKEIPAGHKVVVRLDEWNDPFRPLAGEVIEDLGPADAPGVDVDGLLAGAGVKEKFPEEVLEEAKAISGHVGPERMTDRRDLREGVVFTIDPETARDYDDALSIEPHPSGGWRLGVHIADVSTYVRPGTKLDAEAFRRGNSIYLVDRAVMMLPKELTTRICSLNPNNDHLAHTIELHVSEDGEWLGYDSYPSVIRSAARLTYAQVQRFIEGDSEQAEIPRPVRERLSRLCPLTRRLRERRIAEGSLEINTPEIDIRLDDRGRVARMKPRSEAKDAYNVVEECMLLANRAVAEKLLKAEIPTIFRGHGEPDEEQWGSMGMELQALGIPVLPHSREEINQAVRLAKGTPMEYVANLAVLRNFKRAEYVVERMEHFGLAFADYTHFTSPIRRYADLVVHRLLKAVERGDSPGYAKAELASIVLHCNETERQADELERKSIEGKRMEHYAGVLKEAPDTRFKGYVVSVKGKGFIVELPDSLQRGMVPFSSVVSDWLEADETGTRVVTRSGKVRFRVGDEVEVALAKVDEARGFVDFVPADQVAAPVRSRRRKSQPDARTGRARGGPPVRRRRRR